MSYYEDLSKYEYSKYAVGDTVNIGWLDGTHEFKKGKVTNEFIFALWEYMKYPINQTRGLFLDPELDGDYRAFYAQYEGYAIALGDSEIRVIDPSQKITYAAPNKILHYIMNHQYLPPQEFIDAVMNGPKPNSDQYCEAIRGILSKANSSMETTFACPYCKKHHFYIGHSISKENENMKMIRIVDSNNYIARQKFHPQHMWEYICMDCGKKTRVPYGTF